VLRTRDWLPSGWLRLQESQSLVAWQNLSENCAIATSC
jgi:hypothetical protein